MTRKIEEEYSLTLTNAERQCELGQKLLSFIENEIKLARTRNDSAELTEIQTAALRGQIRSLLALKRLWDEPLPPTPKKG